jgi:hypothetical protein
LAIVLMVGGFEITYLLYIYIDIYRYIYL